MAENKLVLTLSVAVCCSVFNFQQAASTKTTIETGQEVCYGDLGCFSKEKPWIAVLPDTPTTINTEFFLYTQRNRHTPTTFKAGDVTGLKYSHFDGRKPTKFIVHGFIDRGDAPWLKTMADNFLKAEDVNVFCVDWHGGSQTIYGKAAANTRVVAAEIAKMIKFLSRETKLKLEGVHVIGHSLGAHIAGYVGSHLGKLVGRITGMDPAQPLFRDRDPRVRLDKGDADFVDVLHTDAGSLLWILLLRGGYGTWQASGHVDVYINGGVKQPGCSIGNAGQLKTDATKSFIDDMKLMAVESSRWVVSCAHCRSFEYMIETIGSSCPWQSYPCESWEEFNTGRCLRCSSAKNQICNGVGHKAVKPRDGSVNVKYWMATGKSAPFCRYHFHVHLTLASSENTAQNGKLWIKLVGEKSSTSLDLVTSEAILLEPGSSFDFLVTSPTDLGKTMKRVQVKWERKAKWTDVMPLIRTPKIYVNKVTVFSGEHQTETNFCSSEGLKSGESLVPVNCLLKVSQHIS